MKWCPERKNALCLELQSQSAEGKKLDAVLCIGCLIKGETMHFEYFNEAVSQAIMRLGIDTGIPIIFSHQLRPWLGGVAHNVRHIARKLEATQ